MEFPSDNPELWQLRAPRTALALLVAETHEPSAPCIDDASETIAIEVIAEAPAIVALEAHVSDADVSDADAPDAEPDVEVIEFDESDFAGVENESLPPQAMPDLFQMYVRTLVEVALAAGAPGRVVEILPGMVGLARLNAQALDDESIASLVSAGLLARTESGAVARSDAFVAAAQAWRATLLGEEADFSACGSMLDEWSATLIATLAGTPAQKESLRLQLRARGVAAFGLLVDAA